MKKLSFIVILLVSLVNLKAQDTIITQYDGFFKDGKPYLILCKIERLTGRKIFYIENHKHKSDYLGNVNYHSKFTQSVQVTQRTPVDTLKKLRRLKKIVLDTTKITKLSDTNKVVKFVNVVDELNFLKNNLSKSHSEYKTGLKISLAGLGVIGAGALISTFKNVTHNNYKTMMSTTIEMNQIGAGVICFGILGELVGRVIMIDSHKWLGRASVGIGGKGVTVKYTL